MEIETGTHQLETLLCHAIDRNFDKFELYTLRNILCVRPSDPELKDWIRLAHYDGLDLAAAANATAGNETKEPRAEGQQDDDGAGAEFPTIESVTRLRRRLQAAQKLHLALVEEQAQNAALLAELRGLVGQATGSGGADEKDKGKGGGNGAEKTGQPAPSGKGELAFLDSGLARSLAAGDDQPVTTTASFALTQLESVRALSASLRNMRSDLADLSAAAAAKGGRDGAVGDEDGAGGGGAKAWRRERVEYVEGQARRHLETVRGLDMGKQGDVRDGEWQGEGKALGKGDVQDLEKVVALLDGGTSQSGKGASGDLDADAMDES